MTDSRLPKLRAVETLVVPDSRHGRVLLLRDPQGLADGALAIPPGLVGVLARFDGAHGARHIATEEPGVTEDDVLELAALLDRHGYLESPAFEARHAAALHEFDASPLRAAGLAGGAYPGSADELAHYIATRCVPHAPATSAQGRVRALAAPHIDPWRGARGYGASYGALAAALDDEADTFLVLGTSHAPMREPFALCQKGYDTPFGALPCDEEAVAALQKAARFDPYHDRLNHKREHSIEFQAVFLRHLLGDRPARIVPVLAGLGAFQASGRSPQGDDGARRFLDAMAELVAARGRRMVVVAGVDLAHVGPRFGDGDALDEGQRAALAETDDETITLLCAREREGLWRQVAADLDERRVCGLAPMYSLLWAIGAGARGRRVHYEQTIDEEDGSIVSHAGVTFSS